MGYTVLRDVHDKTFENVTFDGAGSGNPDSSGVLELWGACYNLRFRNCTVNENKDGVGNGVKIVDSGAGMHDIVFENPHIMTQPRMGFECIGRAGNRGNGYQRVDLMGGTFEPCGSEPVSYDDDSGTAGHCLIQEITVKGGGLTTLYPWGQGFELNGVHDVTVIGNTFYACRNGILNLQMHDMRDCGWVFEDNLIDQSQAYGGITFNDQANAVVALNVYGGKFARNTIIGAAPSWRVAYLSGCHDMDWRTTVWQDARGGNYATPYQTGCVGNLF